MAMRKCPIPAVEHSQSRTVLVSRLKVPFFDSHGAFDAAAIQQELVAELLPEPVFAAGRTITIELDIVTAHELCSLLFLIIVEKLQMKLAIDSYSHWRVFGLLCRVDYWK
jgi:hypothetical protein